MTVLATLQWRQLQPPDLEAMYALHLSSIAGMALQAVKPEKREFLHSLLLGRGRVLGAWAQDSLVAYGVLQHDLLPEDAPRQLLGLAAAAPLCKLAGAAVAPHWRGHGLQRQLIERRVALAQGASLFATAAPSNPASWHSLLACGLMVRALQYRYGGHARYLVAQVAGERFHAATGQAQSLGLDALAQQQALLERGWRGIAPGAAPDQLGLVPPAAPGPAPDISPGSSPGPMPGPMPGSMPGQSGE